MGRKSWIFVVPFLVLGLFIAGLGIFVVYNQRTTDQKAQKIVGQKLQPLKLLSAAGTFEDFTKTVALNSAANKKTILVFWATWCEPCTRELPLIKKNLEQSEKQGIRYIFINYDEGSPETILREVKSWMISQGLEQVPSYIDLKQELMSQLEVSALPYSVGINTEQKIEWAHSGELSFSQKDIFDQ